MTSPRTTNSKARGGQGARKPSPADPHVETAAEQLRNINERFIDSAKRAGNAYLDVYEAVATGVADYEARLASASQVDGLAKVARAQADFARNVTGAYSSAARALLR